MRKLAIILLLLSSCNLQKEVVKKAKEVRNETTTTDQKTNTLVFEAQKTSDSVSVDDTTVIDETITLFDTTGKVKARIERITSKGRKVKSKSISNGSKSTDISDSKKIECKANEEIETDEKTKIESNNYFAPIFLLSLFVASFILIPLIVRKFKNND